MNFLDELFPKKKDPLKKSTAKRPREDGTKRYHQAKKPSHPISAYSKHSNPASKAKAHALSQAKSRSNPEFSIPYTKSKPSSRPESKWTNSKSDLIQAFAQPVPTTSVNHNNNVVDLEKPKLLQTTSLIDDSNVTFRKVQGTNKSEQSGDDLSRSSSITNLNAESKNKGALSKSKKSASKDRLDKIADKKNDKKALTRNNNKIDDPSSYTTESVQEIESLQRQLQEMANEKSSLALQLGEQKGHMHAIENEMHSLKKMHDQLNQENNMLRSRLKDVAHSPLSDNEKQQLLLESHRHHSSAPASIATNLIEDGAGGDITACPTPDWDKHSSSNVSEISVACLQDRINQMEETHYSTKEELQATVQELNELQRQLTELQQDNYQLLEDKNLMFDSLCRQTERLNESKSEIETLKQRLREKEDDTGQYETAMEREQNLVALVKNAQEEREVLLLKQEQLANELQETINSNSQQVVLIEQLNERIKTLESALDAKNAEHRQLDQELVSVKDQSSGMQIEIDRLTDLLENARTKIVELEQDRALSDKSELDELLDNARKEKDALESEVTHLKEQVARSKNESEKLKDQVSILQEECKVTRNNAKCTQSELEYKCQMLAADKNNLNEQLQQLQEAANGLQVQAQCQLEDKRQLSSVLSETQKLLSEAERRNADLENELVELKKIRKDENEEWEKFQNDLLTSVRVANDFKTEAQQDLQKMIMENKAHREKVRHLEAQIDKLRDTGGVEEGKVIAAVSIDKRQDEVEYQEVQYQEISDKEQNKSEATPPERVSEEVVIRNPATPKSLQNIAERNHDLSDSKLKSSGSSENISIKDPPSLRSEQSYQESEETDDGKELQKFKLKSPSKSFFKKPKLFRNQKGYYVSGPNSLEFPDSNATNNQDSLPYDNASASLPPMINDVLIPQAQEKIEQPVPEMEVKENKPKKIFSMLSTKQKTESSPMKVESKKHLSSQEQKDMNELNSLYADIDPNIPEEFLTPEQKFIVQLKKTYNSTFERKKLKPVANKPKNSLAISKPLLTSVISNPKLKQIADDPTVRLVEDDTTKNLYNTSNVFYPAVQPSNSRRFDDIHASSIQFSYYDTEDSRKTVDTFKADGTLPKSKSLNDLYYQNELNQELMKMSNYQFTRQHSTGSLTNFVSPGGRPSMLNTTVRVASYASTFSDSEASSDKVPDTPSLMKRKIYNKENRETLNELVMNIDPNLPESELTDEQKFVKGMKVSMDEMAMKQTLRKEHKKHLRISGPTKESVWSNPKLASVIKDTNMPPAKPEQKENKIKKLFEKFKPKKNEPTKKAIVAKQISQEDIVHVTTPDEIKKLEKDILFKNKSESDLTKQGLVEDNVKVSESTSSLFKSVIANSDLQKLIENRESPRLGKVAYESEDDSSLNSEFFKPKEKHTSPSVTVTTDQYPSDTASSASSSKKETIHRISSIPPAETFNTFVKQKISPNNQKITFDYDDLVASSSKDGKRNLKISIGLDSFDVDEKVTKPVEIVKSEDVPDKPQEPKTFGEKSFKNESPLKKTEGTNYIPTPESMSLDNNSEGTELTSNQNQTISKFDTKHKNDDLEEDSDQEGKPIASFRKPKPDEEYIEKLYKNRLSDVYDYQILNQPDQVGLNQLLEQSSETKKSPLYIKHSPKYKKQVSVPTRPPPPPPIAASKRNLSEVEDWQLEKPKSPKSESGSLKEGYPFFNTNFKFLEPIVPRRGKNEEDPLEHVKSSKPRSDKDEKGKTKDTILDVNLKFEEPMMNTDIIDEKQLKDVELAERLIREMNTTRLKTEEEPIYVKFNFEDPPLNETKEKDSNVPITVDKERNQVVKTENFTDENSPEQEPQTDDSKNPFLDVKFNFKEPFNKNNNGQSPDNSEAKESTVQKPQVDDLINNFFDVRFSFKEPYNEDVEEVSSDVESISERRIGILSPRTPPVQILGEALEESMPNDETLQTFTRKFEEFKHDQNIVDVNTKVEKPNEDTQPLKQLHDQIEEFVPEVTTNIKLAETKIQNCEDAQSIRIEELNTEEVSAKKVKTEDNVKVHQEEEFELIQPPDMFANDNHILPATPQNPEENISSNEIDASTNTKTPESSLKTEDNKRDSFTSNYFLNFKAVEIDNDGTFENEIKSSNEELKDTHAECIEEAVLKESNIQVKESTLLSEVKVGENLDLLDADLKIKSEKPVPDTLNESNEEPTILTPVILDPENILDEPKVAMEQHESNIEDKANLICEEESVLDSSLPINKVNDAVKSNLQTQELELEDSKVVLPFSKNANENNLDDFIETISQLAEEQEENEEVRQISIEELKLPSVVVNNDTVLNNSTDATNGSIDPINVQDIADSIYTMSFTSRNVDNPKELENTDDQDEESSNLKEVTSASLTLRKDKIEIKQFSYTLKISDRDDVDQFGELERESIQSSTSISTEIDDSDPNFGSVMNTKSKYSRQSSTSSEEEVFRRLSYKLDQTELSFLRDVYRKYDVERVKSPINDGDIALIERAKLNSLSPNFEDNDRISELEMFENDVFMEDNKRIEDQEGNDDDDELTEMELELIRRIQRNREERPISDINEKDLKIITTIRQESLKRKRSRGSDIKLEEASMLISDDLPQQAGLIKATSLEEDNDHIFPGSNNDDQDGSDGELTEMELELIRRIQRNREDRPVSDINEKDLQIITTVRQESLTRNLSRGSDVKPADITTAINDGLIREINLTQDLLLERNSFENDHVDETNSSNINVDKQDLDNTPIQDLENKFKLELPPEENPIKISNQEIIDTEKSSSEAKESIANNISSAFNKDITSEDGIKKEPEDTKITQKKDVNTRQLKSTQKKRNVKGFSSSSFIESLLADDVPMSDSAVSFMKKPTRRRPAGNSKTPEPASIETQDMAQVNLAVDKPEIKNFENPNSEKIENSTQDVVDNFAEKTSLGGKANHENKSEIIGNDDNKSNGLLSDDKKEESSSKIEDEEKKEALSHQKDEQPPKVIVRVADGTEISNIHDTTKKEVTSKLKSLHVTDDVLTKNSQTEENVEDFSSKIFANYATSPAFIRTNSLSDYTRKPGSESSSKNLLKANSTNLTRSKSVESPFLQYRNEVRKSLSNDKEDKLIKSPSYKKGHATFTLNTSKVYEPIYANYIELQKPKKNILTKTAKPPVPSPRYDHTSKYTDKIDSRENAFDSSHNIIMADKGPEKNASPVSLSDDVRDKHNFTQLNVLPSIDSKSEDKKGDDEKGTSSGAKPKKTDGKDSTTKVANNLVLKTSSMEMLYDSEESAGISEKSSLDKSYLEIFKSPEQVLYENLSEPEKSKATFTTIHFFKSGEISSESSNASTQEDMSPNKAPNKVSYLRKKFEQGKKQTVVEELLDEEKLPAEDSQSITANHVLKSVPKASNLPQNIKEFVKEEKPQTTLSSANSSLENLRKNARKSFESARSVFELKLKKQETSEEKICETTGNTNENNNVEGSNHQTIP